MIIHLLAMLTLPLYWAYLALKFAVIVLLSPVLIPYKLIQWLLRKYP